MCTYKCHHRSLDVFTLLDYDEKRPTLVIFLWSNKIIKLQTTPQISVTRVTYLFVVGGIGWHTLEV